MKILLTKRYSWLCLCLLFCSSWLSCTVQNPAHRTIVPIKKQESSTRWVLKMTLLPGSGDLIFPVSGLQNINITGGLTGINFRGNDGQHMVLEYRFKSEDQCRMTLDELLATGMANVISMTQLSN